MESGVNPERAGHCEGESLFKPLGNREGKRDDEPSQDTSFAKKTLSVWQMYDRGSVAVNGRGRFLYFLNKNN